MLLAFRGKYMGSREVKCRQRELTPRAGNILRLRDRNNNGCDVMSGKRLPPYLSRSMRCWYATIKLSSKTEGIQGETIAVTKLQFKCSDYIPYKSWTDKNRFLFLIWSIWLYFASPKVLFVTHTYIHHVFLHVNLRYTNYDHY